MLCVSSLALFSFFRQPQQLKFTRLTDKMYQAKTNIAMNAADKEKFITLIKKVYNIKEFNGDVVLKYLGNKTTGFSIASAKVGTGAFTQNIYDVGEPEEVAAACIYNACPPPPPPPTKGDIMQILNRY